MPLRGIAIWLTVAFLCVMLAFASFAIGESLAKQQSDPDGLFAIGGFALFLVFLALAFSAVMASFATFLFWMRDR